jgi:transposase InsO family protein
VTLEELQAQVDRFDEIYNTQRPRQGLPGRITPRQAWEATPKTDRPRPRKQEGPVGCDGIRRTTFARNGIVQVRQTRFHISRALAGQTVYLIETADHLLVFDDEGTEIKGHRWPKPGTANVSSSRPRGRRPKTT